MENSGYGHLSSPALVVFSQAAASGLSEALRIQRPTFHSQMPDPKDLHHLSLVGSYGAHLLHGFPPHFLHSSISSAAAAAAAAAGSNSAHFGSNGAFVKPFPSAFAPPKCMSASASGMDQQVKHQAALHQAHESRRLMIDCFGDPKNNGIFGGGGGGGGGSGGVGGPGNESSFRRTSDSSSPVCNSMSPPVKEESLEGHNTSEDGDGICTPDRSPETPGFRRECNNMSWCTVQDRLDKMRMLHQTNDWFVG